MAGQASLLFHRTFIKSEFWRKASGKVVLAANIISAKLSCCHETRHRCNCSPCANLHVHEGSSAYVSSTMQLMPSEPSDFATGETEAVVMTKQVDGHEERQVLL